LLALLLETHPFLSVLSRSHWKFQAGICIIDPTVWMQLHCACGDVGSIGFEYSSLRAKISSGWATSTTNHSSTSDPAEAEAVQCLEHGTQKLEEGDVQAAKALYKRSVEIRRNASSLFNLGVTHYHLSAFLNMYD
jgi:hypothetical protein